MEVEGKEDKRFDSLVDNILQMMRYFGKVTKFGNGEQMWAL